MKSIFTVVTALFQSTERFAGVEHIEEVAANLAGLYAADTAANILAAQRDALTDGKVAAATYLSALTSIAEQSLSEMELYVVQNVANATWRAGQPFRGVDRLTRDANKQFNELPFAETGKDLIQVHKGARMILEAWEGSQK